MNPLEIKGQSQKGTVLTKSLISQPLIDLEYKTWYEINVKTMHYSKLWPDLCTSHLYPRLPRGRGFRGHSGA